MSLRSLFWLLALLHLSCYTKEPLTIMIDPAGDMHNPGRLIGDTYERTCTGYVAQQLKHALQKKAHMRVFFSRLPGQQIHHLEKARFANQCRLDLFIHISVCAQDRLKPQLAVYVHSQGHTSARHTTNALIPFEHAQAPYASCTQQIVERMLNTLGTFSRSCEAQGPCYYPMAPLKGILAPALCVECCIKSPEDMHHVIEPLTTAITNAMQEE